MKYIETRGEKMNAENAEQTARNNYADKNYNEAQTAAEEAKRLYTQLGMKEKVSDMDVLLQLMPPSTAHYKISSEELGMRKFISNS